MTVKDNVVRVLEHLGLADAVDITSVEDDRVFGWPLGDKLLTYVKSHGWYRDIPQSAEHFHGEGSTSFREPNSFHPALQVVFHPDQFGPFVEIDLDESAPVDLVGVLWHAKEVLMNSVLGTKTDQKTISKLLDRRFKV